jgi:spore germination protein KC
MKKILLLIFILTTTLMFTGCTNYKEVTDIWMVAGFAVDWDEQNKQYILTAEILKPSGGKESAMVTERVSFSSPTLFSAMRRGITYSGKRLYWAHSNIVVISEEVAKRGIIPIIDIVNRGGEFRSSLYLVISREATAREILEKRMSLYSAASLEIADMFKAQKGVSTYSNSEFWYFFQNYLDEGISPVIATVEIVKDNNKEIPHMLGGAVFKSDKLVGYLDDAESKTLLGILGKLKGGVIVVKDVAGSGTNASLEILGSKNKMEPRIENNDIIMDINLTIYIAISEIAGTENFMEPEGFKKLKASSNEIVKGEMENLVQKAQNEFDSDIFGFGRSIQKKYPEQWKQLQPIWDEKFKTVKANITVDTRIISSYRSYKPVEVGD